MKNKLQQFLGFVNFNQWFIQDFASIAKLLHALTGKKSWTWDSEHATSFQKLKEAVTTSLVLAFPTDDDQFWIEADSSDFASSAVLFQPQHGVWKPVAYMSKALNKVERKCEVHNKEMLAIMCA